MSAAPWARPEEDQTAPWAKPAPATSKDEPGFLDKEIPLDSYAHATESGIQSIGRGFRRIGRGVSDMLDPTPKEGEPVVGGSGNQQLYRFGKGLYDLGKGAMQVPAAIRDINASPDPLYHYGRAAQNMAGEGAAEAAVGAGTLGLGRAIPAITDAVKPSVAEASEAVKPYVTAPIRAGARATEAVANSKLRPFVKIMTPADEAAAAPVKIPGRDFGLPRSQPAAPNPEPDIYRPGFRTPRAFYGGQPPAAIPARSGLLLRGEVEKPGVYPGATQPTATPEQLNPSLVSPSRTLPGQVGKEVIRSPYVGATPIPSRPGLMLESPRAAVWRRMGDLIDQLKTTPEHQPGAPAPEETAPPVLSRGASLRVRGRAVNPNQDLTSAVEDSIKAAAKKKASVQ